MRNGEVGAMCKYVPEGSKSCYGRDGNGQHTLFTLGTNAPAAVFFAFSLASQVKGMSKVAVISSLAQPSLIMFADEVGNT